MKLSGVDFQVRESQFHPSVWIFSFILHYAVEFASLCFYIQYTFSFSFTFLRYSNCLKVKCRQMHRTLQQSNQISAVNYTLSSRVLYIFLNRVCFLININLASELFADLFNHIYGLWGQHFSFLGGFLKRQSTWVELN